MVDIHAYVETELLFKCKAIHLEAKERLGYQFSPVTVEGHASHNKGRLPTEVARVNSLEATFPL